jgi:hypothetical protein
MMKKIKTFYLCVMIFSSFILLFIYLFVKRKRPSVKRNVDEFITPPVSGGTIVIYDVRNEVGNISTGLGVGVHDWDSLYMSAINNSTPDDEFFQMNTSEQDNVLVVADRILQQIESDGVVYRLNVDYTLHTKYYTSTDYIESDTILSDDEYIMMITHNGSTGIWVISSFNKIYSFTRNGGFVREEENDYVKNGVLDDSALLIFGNMKKHGLGYLYYVTQGGSLYKFGDITPIHDHKNGTKVLNVCQFGSSVVYVTTSNKIYSLTKNNGFVHIATCNYNSNQNDTNSTMRQSLLAVNESHVFYIKGTNLFKKSIEEPGGEEVVCYYAESTQDGITDGEISNVNILITLSSGNILLHVLSILSSCDEKNNFVLDNNNDCSCKQNFLFNETTKKCNPCDETRNFVQLDDPNNLYLFNNRLNIDVTNTNTTRCVCKEHHSYDTKTDTCTPCQRNQSRINTYGTTLSDECALLKCSVKAGGISITNGGLKLYDTSNDPTHPSTLVFNNEQDGLCSAFVYGGSEFTSNSPYYQLTTPGYLYREQDHVNIVEPVGNSAPVEATTVHQLPTISVGGVFTHDTVTFNYIVDWKDTDTDTESYIRKVVLSLYVYESQWVLNTPPDEHRDLGGDTSASVVCDNLKASTQYKAVFSTYWAQDGREANGVENGAGHPRVTNIFTTLPDPVGGVVPHHALTTSHGVYTYIANGGNVITNGGNDAVAGPVNLNVVSETSVPEIIDNSTWSETGLNNMNNWAGVDLVDKRGIIQNEMKKICFENKELSSILPESDLCPRYEGSIASCPMGQFMINNNSCETAPPGAVMSQPLGTIYDSIFPNHRINKYTMCVANEYVNGAECTPCEPGTFSGPGSYECVGCAAGQKPGDEQCESCPEGEVGDGVVCNTCPAYQFPSSDKTSCVSCSPGSTHPVGGHDGQCVKCSSDSYNTDGRVCNTCPAHQLPSWDKTSCVSCSPGTTRENGECKKCTGDKYNTDGGECITCRGRIANENRDRCVPCTIDEIWVPGESGRNGSCRGCNDPNEFQLMPNEDKTECIPRANGVDVGGPSYGIGRAQRATVGQQPPQQPQQQVQIRQEPILNTVVNGIGGLFR